MDAERWQRIEGIYHAVLEQPDAKRSSFLEQACAGDADLRREVDSLLIRDALPGSPIDRPAWAGAEGLLEVLVEVSAGTQLGPYKIIGKIGEGGMGQVYQAHDSRLGRSVAVKVANASFSERFEREARTIAALNHPNICTLHDVGPNYLVMELVDGPTLADRIRRGPVPLPEALEIARQIAEALEAAHEKGIIHRDLKPGNIKIKPDGKVKVLDFGLAKSMQSPNPESLDSSAAGSERSVPGMILGTAAYMSPEQARGLPVDKRTDIFAFGAVVYEMLTGKRAFEGDSNSDIFAAVLKTEPDWTCLPAELPSSVQNLLRSCLEKSVKNRRRDAGDLRLEIDAAIANFTPVPANHSKATSISRRPHHPWRLAIVAVVVLASLAMGAIYGLKYLRSGTMDATTAPPPPLVMMMDSPNPGLVYDDETLAANGTNADVISDILADLPIRKQKETVGPEWHRDEEVLKFRPDLIIIHFSAFDPRRGFVPKDRIKVFIKFLADTPTKLLIYSRRPGARLRTEVDALLEDVYLQHPGLKQRVNVFGVSDYGPQRWRDRVTGTQLKLVVKDILKLP
jgi:serine/threonine protein kinase